MAHESNIQPGTLLPCFGTAPATTVAVYHDATIDVANLATDLMDTYGHILVHAEGRPGFVALIENLSTAIRQRRAAQQNILASSSSEIY